MPDTLDDLRALLGATYRVDRVLGSGGMATVYLAHDLRHDRPVAIKVLRQALAVELGRERFLREIRIAATLNHPHILPLHDSGEVVVDPGDGTPPRQWLYYVTPYVAGETLLDQIARERQMPIDDVVRIAREVAGALAFAHGHGVIHRDIKPANILLSDGYALVADFGLARAITSARASSAITRGGLTLGTPAYMSPEQASGDAELDGRSDIYALGCVVYEMLVGDPPFVASNPAAVLARHAAATAIPVRRLRPTVPPALEAAVMRALAKAPADRFQTAGAFGAALAAAAGDPGRVRRRIPAAVVTAVVGVLGIGALVWFAANGRPGTRAARADASPARTALQRGIDALDTWDLDGADSALARAMLLDSSDARPAVWLAAARNWAGAPAGRWATLLGRATGNSGDLDARTSAIATALGAEADSAWDRACAEWRRLTRPNGGDFVSWFGLANCLARDHVVLADPASASGWRFRASAQEMVTAYRHAFEHLGHVTAAIPIGRFTPIRDRFFARSQLRAGRIIGSGTEMLATAGWAGDTLVFVPFSAAHVMAGAPETQPPGGREAVIRERRALADVASAWLAADPGSAAALEALANALQLEGDRSAIDTLRRARAIARDAGDRVRLACAEIWYQLTTSLPDDSIELRRVRLLADSLLARPDPGSADRLSGVAALRGRATLAARLSGKAGLGNDEPMLPAIAQDGPALLVYAAFGGPRDSIRRLESVVAGAIDRAALADERARFTESWLGRAARIAYPDVRFTELPRLGLGRDGLLAAQAAFDTGNATVARNYLAMRGHEGAENDAPEAVYAEARLLLAMGDSAGAAAWLDRILDLLSALDPDALSQISNAAALVRAMALRADIAAAMHDAGSAARWARPVQLLWSSSDAFLQSTVRRMARLATAPSPHARSP